MILALLMSVLGYQSKDSCKRWKKSGFSGSFPSSLWELWTGVPCAADLERCPWEFWEDCEWSETMRLKASFRSLADLTANSYFNYIGFLAFVCVSFFLNVRFLNPFVRTSVTIFKHKRGRKSQEGVLNIWE